MRVLVVTPWYPTPERPHIGVFVQRDVETLRRSHEVRVLHLTDTGAASTDEVERVAFRRGSPISAARARRRVRELARAADVLHSHAISVLPAIPRRLRLPWVHTEHWSGLLNPETASLPIRVAGSVLARSLRRPDVVIAVSERLGDAIAAHRRGETVVIPNAVTAPTGASAPSRDLVLAAVGGLIDRKQPLVAVETVAALARRGADPVLVWAGDGPERDAVRSRAAELGVSDRIDLRGDVSPAEISAVLQSARLFLLPTRGETFGVAIAEALRHGLPVVVGDSGGHTEYIRAEDGELVGGSDPELWADAVERALILDRDEIRRSAESRFSEDARVAAFDEAYRTAALIKEGI